MIREFAILLITTHFFPTTEKQYLARQEFLLKMEDAYNVILKPNELRKRFTEYVLKNKDRAMLPSR